MTAGGDQLAELFSIFHDGWIASIRVESPDLVLTVNIRYLTERAVPGSTSFVMRLCAVERFAFTPWATSGAAPERVLTVPDDIAAAELEILDGVPTAHDVLVICLWPGSSASGGELSVVAGGAAVFDESGREWTLEALRELARQYWQDWEERCRATRGR